MFIPLYAFWLWASEVNRNQETMAVRDKRQRGCWTSALMGMVAFVQPVLEKVLASLDTSRFILTREDSRI